MNSDSTIQSNITTISNKTLSEIKSALDSGKSTIEISTDLGISSTKILLDPEKNLFFIREDEGILFPESFNEKEKICYSIMEGKIFPIKIFSEESNYFYKLVPTSWRPILRISATQMHKKDFLDFLESQSQTLRGFVLDSGTGLGYSAIIASQYAAKVITVEWDKQVLEIARLNPHSSKLFNSMNIQSILGDITQEIVNFEDNYFNAIIQDGGMPKTSGEFFSQSNCIELYRVLDRGGLLFFYLPQHGKSKGRDFGREHINRLIKAGFYLRKRYFEGSFAVFYKG